MKTSNNSWYSVILAILMVWFMLILTVGVFSLILGESKDTKAFENYFKAISWAEWSLELAMLKAKQYNYSYSDIITNDINDLSVILSSDFLDKSKFNSVKDVLISYELNATSQDIIDKKIQKYTFDIIPLFFYDINWVYKKVKNISLFWVNNNVVWNIVWENSWISWVWDFTNISSGNYKIIYSWNIVFSQKSIGDFLNDSEKNYLIIHNLSSNDINYTLSSLNPWEFLTNEVNYIIWTGEIWWYKQNLRVKINTSQYLNLLKYSIFSN